ncbi:GQ67_04285T0 [Komagataella phaffii]|nr:GQ67_04285T0 [Komagataella phaffii]AOA69004.1 GQ68_04257T0 [Komagataella phaffii GS115]
MTAINFYKLFEYKISSPKTVLVFFHNKKIWKLSTATNLFSCKSSRKFKVWSSIFITTNQELYKYYSPLFVSEIKFSRYTIFFKHDLPSRLLHQLVKIHLVIFTYTLENPNFSTF